MIMYRRRSDSGPTVLPAVDLVRVCVYMEERVSRCVKNISHDTYITAHQRKTMDE